MPVFKGPERSAGALWRRDRVRALVTRNRRRGNAQVGNPRAPPPTSPPSPPPAASEPNTPLPGLAAPEQLSSTTSPGTSTTSTTNTSPPAPPRLLPNPDQLDTISELSLPPAAIRPEGDDGDWQRVEDGEAEGEPLPAYNAEQPPPAFEDVYEAPPLFDEAGGWTVEEWRRGDERDGVEDVEEENDEEGEGMDEDVEEVDAEGGVWGAHLLSWRLW